MNFPWTKRSPITFDESKITTDELVIGSKRVRKVVKESYEASISASASEDEIARVKSEIAKYAELIGYPGARIYKRTEDDRIIFWFGGVQSMTGTDFNKGVFTNIIWVEDELA